MGDTICIVPARGGSKRLPRKNVLNFRGKPRLSQISRIGVNADDPISSATLHLEGIKTCVAPYI